MIFYSATETAEKLGYSKRYFKNNWRNICMAIEAPFPVNTKGAGTKRWRIADIDAYASGKSFLHNPPATTNSGNPSTEPEENDETNVISFDWERHLMDKIKTMK